MEGSTTREVFEAYVERMLAPTLRAGQIVVMDNLMAHKGEKVRELIEERGCELLYLSPYSPDLNPIEEAFSKVKRLLRKAEARSRWRRRWRHWGERFLRSALEMLKASSSTAATVSRSNFCGTRCNTRHGSTQSCAKTWIVCVLFVQPGVVHIY